MAIDTVRIKDLEEVSVNDLANLWMVVDSGTPDSTNKVKLSALAGYIGGQAEGRYIPLAGSSEITGSLLPKADKAIALGSGSFRWSALYSGEVHASDVLAIPTTAPDSTQTDFYDSSKVYLWADSDGNYSEIPGGGGVADIYDLTLRRGSVSVGPYNLGEQAADIDLASLFSGYATESYVGNRISALNLGTASQKDWVDSVAQGGTGLPTSGAVYSAIAAAVTSALHYRGMSSAPLTDGGTEIAVIGGESLVAQSGDVVIYGGFEFLWENDVWNKLGDDTSYALKTIQVAGDGTYITGGGQLTQNQTLTLSNSVIASLGKADTAVQPAALGDYLPLTAGSSKALTGNLYLNLSNPTIFGNVSGSYYSMLELSNNGSLFIGNDQIANGKATYVKGSSIYFTWGASDSTKSARFTASTLRPSTADSGLTLGTSSYKWSALYATTLYGNLALSYLTDADDLKAIEALTETSGFLKKTAANTWALDNEVEATSLKTTTEQDAMFTSRQVPSVAVGDVCKITSVKGKSVVWNQLIQNGDFSQGTSGWQASSAQWSVSDGTLSFTATAQYGRIQQSIAILNHTYYLAADISSANPVHIQVRNETQSRAYLNGVIVNGRNSFIFSVTGSAEANIIRLRILNYASSSWSSVTVDNVILVDLTAAGLDNLTAAEFEALYPLPYYGYNTGKLVNNTANGVEMLDAGGNSLGTIPLNITGLTSGGVQIFPDGMKSAGSVADEWSGNTATKRIGVVDLGTLTWSISGGVFFTTGLRAVIKNKTSTLLCDKYTTNNDSVVISSMPDKSVGSNSGVAGVLWIKDSSYTTAADFKAAMSGVLLYYELKEPETYTVDALPDTLVAFDAQGTQRRLPVDTSEEVAAPMVCDFVYGANIGDLLPTVDYKIRHGHVALADEAIKLQTARTIWGQSFDGTANVSGALTEVTDITGTGLITMPNGKFSSSLIIPHIAPTGTLESEESYLYASATGNFSEEAPDAVGIASVIQTSSSSESGGTNIVTVTLTDGSKSTFGVRNGQQGNSGYSGAAGELEVVNNLTDGGATAALSAEMGKILDGKIGALKDKNLNKRLFGTRVSGSAPWPGFVVSDYIDIPASHFTSRMYNWGARPGFGFRYVDSGGNIITLTRKTGTLFNSFVIDYYDIPASAVTIRLPLYNLTEEQIASIFIGSDSDADYLSWPFLAKGTLPAVTSAWYAGDSDEIKAIVDAYPEYKDMTGYPSVRVSSKNLFSLKDVMFYDYNTVSPGYPTYYSGYMPVEAGKKYTLSFKGTFSPQTYYYTSEKVYIERSLYATSTAPATAAFARVALTSYNDVHLLDPSSEVQFEQSEFATSYEPYFIYGTDDISVPLKDKGFAFLGDSFTAGNLWCTTMASILKAKVVYNAAVSGSTWSTNAPDQADRLISSGSTPDYILCFLGVNDANNTMPLGNIVYSNNIAELESSTFTGGVQRALNKLMNAFPSAVIKIGWTPAGQSFTGTLDVSQYINRLKDLSIVYGVQFVETRYCGISPYIDADADYYEYGTGGGHPTATGQTRIGEAMARIMASNQ